MDLSTSSIMVDRNALTNRGTLNVVDMVETDDNLRPMDTYWFKKGYTEKPYDFPYQVVLGKNSVWTMDPIDTRASLQNLLLMKRHFNK